MTQNGDGAPIEAAFRAVCAFEPRFSLRFENGHPILAAAGEEFYAFEDPWSGWRLGHAGGSSAEGVDLDRPRSVSAAAERLVRDERLSHVPLPVDLDGGRWQALRLEPRAGEAEAPFLSATDALALRVDDRALKVASTIVIPPDAPLEGPALVALFGTQERLDRWNGTALRFLRSSGAAEQELGLRYARSRF